MSVGSTFAASASPVDDLARKLGCTWSNVVSARERASENLDRLANLLKSEVSADTSLVVHGSLARREFTQDSDLDWTLLVDGQANPQHQTDLLRIREKLESAGFRPPGSEGTF